MASGTEGIGTSWLKPFSGGLAEGKNEHENLRVTRRGNETGNGRGNGLGCYLGDQRVGCSGLLMGGLSTCCCCRPSARTPSYESKDLTG